MQIDFRLRASGFPLRKTGPAFRRTDFSGAGRLSPPFECSYDSCPHTIDSFAEFSFPEKDGCGAFHGREIIADFRASVAAARVGRARKRQHYSVNALVHVATGRRLQNQSHFFAFGQSACSVC